MGGGVGGDRGGGMGRGLQDGARAPSQKTDEERLERERQRGEIWKEDHSVCPLLYHSAPGCRGQTSRLCVSEGESLYLSLQQHFPVA